MYARGFGAKDLHLQVSCQDHTSVGKRFALAIFMPTLLALGRVGQKIHMRVCSIFCSGFDIGYRGV